MGANRKLQTEIDRTLKKVMEGIEVFDQIWEKVYDADNINQKEKYEADLKKEIKKLQRYRDQIKTWISSTDIKDKAPLMDARKAVERQMERFKVCEKETKTKAFSKEGLGQALKMDPREQARTAMREWINQTVDNLNVEIETFDAELEGLQGQKKKNKPPPRMAHLEESSTRHRQHVVRLEQILRLLDNEALAPDEIEEVKELVEDYLERNQESFDEFENPDDLYAEMIDLLDGLEAQLPTTIVQHIGKTANPREKEKEKEKERERDRERERERAVAAAAKQQLAAHNGIRLDDDEPSPAKLPRKSSDTSPGAHTPLKLAVAVPPPPPARPASLAIPPASRAEATDSSTTTPHAGTTTPGATTPARNHSFQHATPPAVHPLTAIPPPPPRVEASPLLSPQVATSLEENGRASSSASSATAEAPQPSTTNRPLAAAAAAPGPPTPGAFPQLGEPRGRSDIAAVVVDPNKRAPPHLASQAPQQNGVAGPSPPSSMPAPGATSMAAAAGRQMEAGPSGGKDQEPQPLPDFQLGESFDGKAVGMADLSKMAGDLASLGLTPRPELDGGASGLGPLSATALVSPAANLQMLQACATRSIPQPIDSQWQATPVRMRLPPNGVPASYPQIKLPILDNPALFEKLDTEALFFAFYYQPGTYQQYLAARELKRQSWRYHKQHGAWFQRHEEPKTATEDYEQGTYVYFDYNIMHDDLQSGWCYRLKQDFTFKYDALEDELQV
ncbi:hypothetical protein WJX72_004900 [[Myrmecia] bisecta]|uniref:CCR4-NOT transcription complex subunit 3 n=1 Tax=[Myrmecia] bisecta TaxID=41462 RepID=A0AAW1Q116_9CHLO